MIKKLICGVLIFAAVSVFSQEVKDQIGVAESFEFNMKKFVLSKSIQNEDKSVFQEYVTIENIEKKEKKEEKKLTKDAVRDRKFDRIEVLFVPNTSHKELLEKKMHEIRREKSITNLQVSEINNGFKVTYLDSSENSKKTGEYKTIFYKSEDLGNGLNSYIIEYLPSNGKPSAEMEINFLKFAETFPNR